MTKESGSTSRAPIAMAVLAMAAGILPILIALGVLKPDPSTIHAPLWVLGLCGIVFVLAGIMILTGQKSRVTAVLGAVLCICFGAVGAWVALLAPSGGFSGGIPLLSSGVNAAIARVLFGFGALLCFFLAIHSLRQVFRNRTG